MKSTLLIDSPVGPLLLTGDGRSLTGLHFSNKLRRTRVEPAGAPAPASVLVETRRQLDAYFAGDLEVFDVPVAPHGTEFQELVWSTLLSIPFGMTATYGDIARRLGMQPGAARAVGLANGANPIAIVIPCHRVIGADGTLTGYGGGLERKRFLLDLESKKAPQGTLFD